MKVYERAAHPGGVDRPLISLALVAPLLLAGCATQPAASPADVVATFYPMAFLVERIAADNLTVATLVPPGVEPHDWEPSAADVAQMGAARLVVAQGAGFEPWLPHLLGNLGERAPRLVDTSAGLQLIAGGDGPAHDADESEHEGEAHDESVHEEAGALDPHTWLDPVRFAQQARAVEDALVAAWPEHAEAFRARGDALRNELADLDRQFHDALDACEIRAIIANHDAYTYMADRYAFEVISISGLSPEAEPSPQDVARAVEAARAHNVTVIFFEELVSPRVAQVVADEVGARTRVLSPIEGIPDAERARGADYVTLQKANIQNLAEAMRCA